MFVQPCAATATQVLFAVDKQIFCLDHESLGLVRTFVGHQDAILILSVNNDGTHAKDRCLALSYDRARELIIWEVSSGDMLAKCFVEITTVAAWLGGGCVALGWSAF